MWVRGAFPYVDQSFHNLNFLPEKKEEDLSFLTGLSRCGSEREKEEIRLKNWPTSKNGDKLFIICYHYEKLVLDSARTFWWAIENKQRKYLFINSSGSVPYYKMWTTEIKSPSLLCAYTCVRMGRFLSKVSEQQAWRIHLRVEAECSFMAPVQSKSKPS